MTHLRLSGGRYRYKRKYPNVVLVHMGRREFKANFGVILQAEAEMAAQLLSRRYDKHVSESHH